jgi:hypothetical protein
MVPPLTMMFLVFMSMLFVFGWGITNNANQIKNYVYDSCEARLVIENNSNKLLDQLIDSAAKSTVFSPAEKAERISGWRAVRHESERCVRL